MNGHSSYKWLLLTLIILSLLSVAIFFERTGLSYSSDQSELSFLDPIETIETEILSFDDTHKDNLLLFDQLGIEGPSVYATVKYSLESMHVQYDAVDVSESTLPGLNEYSIVIIAFTDLQKIEEQILELMEWVNSGGRILFAIRPNPSQSFTSIYRKMGIISKSDELVAVRGVKFLDDLFPGAEGLSLGEDFLFHNSLPVQLDENCQIHLVTSDQYELPILWTYDYGYGRVVVLNSDQFANKSARGTIAAAYSLLDDVFVYPVINSAMFFIDDFPSPIPGGEHELVTKEFGRNLQSFYVNIWWPDMQSFARRYGIKYTGMFIETYEDIVDPPFKTQTSVEMFSYLGNSLLRGGGEIGWHGYNHVPLCLEGSDIYRELEYPYWPSENAIRESLEELFDFGNELFGDQPLTTYVPPSNILCPQTREWLPDALPGLRVIASVYLPDLDQSEYEQEFMESADGIIELPRIFAGFIPGDFMRWTAINEIVMHYVHSQFVHPDDILDEERSGGYGWAYLRNSLDDYLLWLYRSVPGIRNMTAREGAMAVQRYARLGVESEFDQDDYIIYLDNFYDEAYLLMRSKYNPESIEGGQLTKIGGSLFLIKAVESEITIRFEERQTTIPVTGEILQSEDILEEQHSTKMVSVQKEDASPEMIPTEVMIGKLVDDFSLGEKVQVNGTGERGLRMRKNPGFIYGASFIAKEDEIFALVEGPQQDGETVWWRIQSIVDPAKNGWSVENYLLDFKIEE